MKVFEMNCSQNGDYLIAGEFEKQIQVWDTKKNLKLCEMKTHFEACGNRMSVSNSGKFFSVAAYGRFGIELYDIEKQTLIWKNKEIKRIQGVYFSSDDTLLYVINNDDKMYTLSVSDGSIQNVEKYVRKLFLSEYGNIKVSDNKEFTYNNIAVPIDTMYIDICLLENGFCYSVAGYKGLYCCDLTGKIIWKVKSETDGNFINLSYSKSTKCISAVQQRKSDIPDRNWDYYVYTFDSKTGRLICSKKLEYLNEVHCFVFVDKCEKLISNTGEIYQFIDNNWRLLDCAYTF